MMAKMFTRVDIRQMHLDDMGVRTLDGIEDGDRGVAVSPCVKDHRLACAPRVLDPGDEITFVVGLTEMQRHVFTARCCRKARLDIGKRLVAIDIRLTAAEQIEVGSVEDVNRLDHGALLRGPARSFLNRLPAAKKA